MNQLDFDPIPALPSRIDQHQVAGPSYMHNTPAAAADTSAPSVGPSHRRSAAAANGNTASARKRRSLAADESEDSGTSRKSREPTKKKKAARACFHCQKAHLTCDDSRPCQRCIKRGLGDNCMEGQRKKAKYLLDDSELEALKNQKKSGNNGPDVAQPEALTGPDPMFNLSFDPNFQFGSEAANLEYSILSAILGNPNHDHPHMPNVQPSAAGSGYGQRFATSAWPADPSMQVMIQQPSHTGEPTSGFDPNNQQPNSSPQFEMPPVFDERALDPSLQSTQSQIQSAPVLQTEFGATIYSAASGSFQASRTGNMQQTQFNSFTQQQTQIQQEPETRSTSNQKTSTAPTYSRSISGIGTPPTPVESSMSGQSTTPQESSGAAVSASNAWSAHQQRHAALERIERIDKSCDQVYESVVKAYDYTKSYHFLMKFLPTRFEKNDILRVVRALAIFRPSLIALQTPLSEEDEIFVEKCFQRSLLEFDKLISFSGTPTVVWRRTGEICLVGAEFCLLTEWSKDDLVNGGKYIYELFENQSVVEYWENFAVHAFENTTQSVYSHCVLLKPSGEPVPCAFCFSIRRDIFDLPSVVIGQWLPLI